MLLQKIIKKFKGDTIGGYKSGTKNKIKNFKLITKNWQKKL